MQTIAEITLHADSRWTILELVRTKGNRNTLARCVCNCGTEKTVQLGSLKNGNTLSCGCLKKERLTTHGQGGNGKQSPAYRSWDAMIQRCTNQKDKRYQDYGGRGITVCPEWLDFEAFYRDMGDRPAGTSIDKIDNNGNYEPDNCRWATGSEQQRNKRNNKFVQYQGKLILLAELADITGIANSTLRNRIFELGWTVEQAASTPVGESRQKCDQYSSQHSEISGLVVTPAILVNVTETATSNS